MSSSAPEQPKLAHRPGLDGLRAVAVMVVVAFHTGLLAGGWVGVDLFFALSGWLITGLLVVEVEQSATLRVGAFWRRRIRRLVPAVGVLLGVVAVMTTFHAIELRRRGVTGAITYSTNWLNMFGGVGYWDHFAKPDPLEHLWSLAVEEQIYLIWPLVMLAVVAAGGRARAIRTAAVFIAFGSTTVMLYGSHAGWSIDRLYQGTDTRALAFAIGAASAGLSLRRLGNLVNHLVVVAAMLGIVWIGWNGATELTMFRGPMQAISLLGLLAVLAAAGITRGPLCWAVPRRIGMWSYGIYLFHWPLTIAFNGRFSDPVWFVVVASLSTAAAALSFWAVEQRVRRSGLPGWRFALAAVTATAFVVTAFFLTTPTAPASAQRARALPVLLPRPSVPVEQAHRRVLIVGDSVPALAADRLVAVGRRRGFDVGVVAEPGCTASPYPTDQYDRAVCVPFIAGLKDAIDKADPDLVAWWWGGTGEGLMWNAKPVTTCSAAGTDALTERLTWLLGLSAPIPTVLVAPVPRTDLPPAAAAGTSCEDRAYAAVGAATEVPVIRLDTLVCPEYPTDCERVPRTDGLHYTPAGADQVAGYLFDHITDGTPNAVTSTDGTTPANTPLRRILVIGDSTAEAVASGLAAAGRFDVVDASRLGCPFVITKAVHLDVGQTLDTSYCPSADDRIAWVQQYRPDAIVLAQGPSEEWDDLYADGDWQQPGTATWIRHHDATMDSLLAAGGRIPIIVMNAPSHRPPTTTSLESPARLQQWNDLIRTWAQRHPTLAVVDIAKYMPEPGSPLDLIWRPDGVHMAKDIAAALARDHLVDDVLAAISSVTANQS